jgi:tRNA (adenine57-N1/adenine58-N1)-methyltransferase
MMLLHSDNGTMLYDDEKNVIINGKKRIEVNPAAVLSPGDSVMFDGISYVIMSYTPQFFPNIGERGAQIINGRDSSYMVMASGIEFGSTVIESGTGSGALTTYILKIIKNPEGYIGIDHNENSALFTRRNVKNFTGMDIRIDIGEFEDYKYEGRKVDAIFLDLPEPWKNVSEQRKWILSGKRIITYLPTFNQVEKSREEYEKNGFLHLETIEIEGRDIQVKIGATRPKSTGIIHTGFISTYMKSSGSVLKI